MSELRNVYLFGAGSAIAWNAPTTTELTKLVLNSGFPISNSETKLTQFIYDKLLESGYHKDEINFETIINVLEELIIYYSEFNNKKSSPSLLVPFLDSKFDEQIMNFSIEGGLRKIGYKLQIPKGKNYTFSKIANENYPPKQFYLSQEIFLLLTTINQSISKYAYHTPGHSVLNLESEVSCHYRKWLLKQSNEGVLRLYTLNYDRILKNLAQKEDIDLFEGFTNPDDAMPGSPSRVDIIKIINDFNSNCHYNLHGSSYWRLNPLHQNSSKQEIVFHGSPHLPLNNEIVNIQIEKGKPLLLSNIITGYQKSQKAMIAPFKQMQSAFDRDCINADRIYIIGYSIGDEHINQSIKTALRHNSKVKIIIVNPSFTKDNMDYHLANEFFPFDITAMLCPKNLSQNKLSFLDGKITVHIQNFEDFLKSQNG